LGKSSFPHLAPGFVHFELHSGRKKATVRSLKSTPGNAIDFVLACISPRNLPPFGRRKFRWHFAH
jgi:hypothetical protein